MEFSLSNKAACLMFAVACTLTAGADFRVQGYPYGKNSVTEIKTSGRMQNHKRVSATDGITGFEDILFWAGDGYKRAAIVFQWNIGGETHSRAYGYRFNGNATGYDMLKAVVEEAPELFAQVMYTYNPEGYVLGGVGLTQNRGEQLSIVCDGQTYALQPDQLFISTGGYNFDSYTCSTPGAWWQSGWYDGYWSYWTGDPTMLNYSGTGMSATPLGDGSWNFWNYSTEVNPDASHPDLTWLPIEAAEDYIPLGAVSSLTSEGLHYNVTNPRINTLWITLPSEGQTYTGSTIVPHFVNGNNGTYVVTGVTDKAFAGTGVTDVTLPQSVEYLGEYVFEDCKDLATVTLPKNLAYFGEGLFKGCSAMKSVIWPAEFDKIKSWQYAGTGITSLELPENITVIGSHAFSDCPDLHTVNFDYEIESIGAEAFKGSPVREITILQTTPPALEENVFDAETLANAVLTVPAGFTETYRNAAGWSSFENIKEIILEINNGDKFINNGVRYEVTSVENRQARVTHYGEQTNGPAIAKDNVTGYVGEVTIPETVKYMGVTFTVNEIADYALYGSSVTSLSVSSTIEKWGYRVFANSLLLTDLHLGEYLQTIGEGAFQDCTALTKLQIPQTLHTVYAYAFWGCKSLKEVEGTFDSIHHYYERAFSDCGFEKIELGSTYLHNDVTPLGYPQYGSNVFADNANLKEIVFPEDFGDKYSTADGKEFYPSFSGWFRNCTALESVDMSKAKTNNLGGSMFSGCSSLSDFKFPPMLETMEASVFYGTAIPHFDLPSTLTSIGSNCFGKNSLITEMVIPEGVTVINELFQYCDNLKKVEIKGKVETIGNYAFSNTVSRPCSIEELVFSAANQVEGKIALPDGLKVIGNEAFCGQPWDFVVPTSVTELNSNCFKDTKLSEIHLKGLSKWDSGTFYNCPEDLVIYYESLNPVIPHMYALHKINYYDSEHYRIRIPDGSHYAEAFHNAKYSYVKTSYYEDGGWDTPGFTGMEARDMNVSPDGKVLTVYPVPVYEHADWKEDFLANNTHQIYGLGDCSVICKRVDEESSRVRAAAGNNDETSFDDYTELNGYDHGYGRAVESDIESLPVGNYVARIKYDDSMAGSNYGIHYGPEFTFTRQISTGIAEIADGHLSMDWHNGKLLVTGCSGFDLSIYDAAGHIILHEKVTEAVKTVTTDFAEGIYIARCGNKVCKFVVR